MDTTLGPVYVASDEAENVIMYDGIAYTTMPHEFMIFEASARARDFRDRKMGRMERVSFVKWEDVK